MHMLYLRIKKKPKGCFLDKSTKFIGKTSYKVYVENTGDNPITVTAKRLTKTYGSTKISAGKTGSFEFSNIKSDTEFYIVFEGNGYSFSGYVK